MSYTYNINQPSLPPNLQIIYTTHRSMSHQQQIIAQISLNQPTLHHHAILQTSPITPQQYLQSIGYQLVRLLSANGNHQVWEVIKNGYKLAIKIIHTQFLSINQQFHLQYYQKILNSIKSQYCVKMYSNIYCRFQIINWLDYKYIIMQYASMGDLTSYLVVYSSLTTFAKLQHYNWSRNVFYQICIAIKDVHSHGYVFRDLKPQNVLMSDGRIKLGDFGLSIPAGMVDVFFCGTVSYMAPERLWVDQLDKPVHYSVDIWSLGIVAYQIFLGSLPYHSQSPNQLRQQFYQHSLLFPNQFPNDAKQLIKSMLSLNAINRPTITQIINHKLFTDQSDQDYIVNSEFICSNS